MIHTTRRALRSSPPGMHTHMAISAYLNRSMARGWPDVLLETPLTQLGWKSFALTRHRYEKEFDAVQDHFELQVRLSALI